MAARDVALRDLLMALFVSPDQLEDFLWELPGGEDILDDISGDGRRSHATSAVRQLQATGLITDRLFGNLRKARAGRLADIDAVAAQWADTVAAARPTGIDTLTRNEARQLLRAVCQGHASEGVLLSRAGTLTGIDELRSLLDAHGLHAAADAWMARRGA